MQVAIHAWERRWADVGGAAPDASRGRQSRRLCLVRRKADGCAQGVVGGAASDSGSKGRQERRNAKTFVEKIRFMAKLLKKCSKIANVLQAAESSLPLFGRVSRKYAFA